LHRIDAIEKKIGAGLIEEVLALDKVRRDLATAYAASS